MGDAAAIILLIVLCLVGVAITALRLPGTWLIVAAATGYSWWTGWAPLTPGWLLALGAMALVGEAGEAAVSYLTARRAGATRQSAWGGLLGGFLGMFFFSVPLPIVGTFIGAILGCFAGALIAELLVHNRLGQGTRVGIFSAVGFALGVVAKVGLSLAMAGAVTIVVLWPRAAEVVPPGTTKPPVVIDQE